MIKIACCSPLSWDFVPIGFHISILDLQLYGLLYAKKRYMLLPIMSRHPFIDQNREELAQKAIRHKVDYIFWADGDGEYCKDMIERLLYHKKDIVTGLSIRRNDGLLNVYEFDERVNKFCSISGIEKKGLLKIGLTGMMGVLMKTSVFEKLTPPYFAMKGDGFGEDVSFFKKCKAVGIDIYCDTDLAVGHILTKAKYPFKEDTSIRANFQRNYSDLKEEKK